MILRTRLCGTAVHPSGTAAAGAAAAAAGAGAGAAGAAAGWAAAGWAADAGAASAAARTSALTTRPFGPVPLTVAMSTPSSRARRRALGLVNRRPPSPFAAGAAPTSTCCGDAVAGAGVSGAAASSGAACTAASNSVSVPVAVAAADVAASPPSAAGATPTPRSASSFSASEAGSSTPSRIAMGSPTGTVAPFPTRSVCTIASMSDSTSTTAFSVSTEAIVCPLATWAPCSTVQDSRTASSESADTPGMRK